MSDGWQSTTSRPIINVIIGVDGMLTLRFATDCSGKDFSPGVKDLSKLKAQYEMFVDAVDSKQVTV